jgi:hypothetical protein
MRPWVSAFRSPAKYLIAMTGAFAGQNISEKFPVIIGAAKL